MPTTHDTTADLDEIQADVIKLGLEPYITQFEAYGYTVVPPELVAPPEFQQRMLETILDVHERRTGQRLRDLGKEAALAGHFGLLFEDRVFEEAVLNPVVRTLTSYACGKSVVLSDMLAYLKPKHDVPTHELHTDSVGMPAPLPQYAQVCNVTWIHTDYSKDNGSVAIVPGSHRFGRHPFPHEEDFLAADSPFQPIAIEAPAGSIIFWHGNTWHGAWPRSAPGVRINTLMYFCRSYVRQMQDLRLKVTDEMLERNPPEFAALVGCKHPYPLLNNQLNPNEQVAWFQNSGRSQWA